MDLNNIALWIKNNYLEIGTTIILVLTTLKPFIEFFRNRDNKWFLDKISKDNVLNNKVVSELLAEMKGSFNDYIDENKNIIGKLIEDNKSLIESNVKKDNAIISLLVVANVPLSEKKEYYKVLSQSSEVDKAQLELLEKHIENSEKENVIEKEKANEQIKKLEKF